MAQPQVQGAERMIFRRKRPIAHPIPPLPPAPIPPGATVLALVSTSAKVPYSALLAAAPVLEQYAALVKRAWPGVPTLAVRVYLTAAMAPPGAWVARVQDASPGGFLGQHFLGTDGLPHILVEALPGWFTTLTHELAEALVNPRMGSVTIPFRGQQVLILREVADPVSDRSFTLAGRRCADFCWPSWFQSDGKPPFNQRDSIRAPFGLDGGGYVSTPDGRMLS